MPDPYLDFRPGHQQGDVLVALAGQQGYGIFPILDLDTIYLNKKTGLC